MTSKTIEMEVTVQEEAIIRQHRIAERKKYQKTALRMLGVAKNYLAWLDENGAGDTYSTFCDDFGYEPQVPGESRSLTHSVVMQIINYARQVTVESKSL